MSSLTLTLSGNSSSLVANYFPPIELDRNSNYVCCLVDFQTYNTIPNVTVMNNKFHIRKIASKILLKGKYTLEWLHESIQEMLETENDWTDESKNKLVHEIWDLMSPIPGVTKLRQLGKDLEHEYYVQRVHEIPPGSYELKDLISVLRTKEPGILITVDKNSTKCTIENTMNKLFVDFTKDGSIRNILGFKSKVINPKTKSIGDRPVNITELNAIRIDCSIATGSYMNGKSSRNIHEFYPAVASGYKIVEVPKNLIYVPVVGHTIHTLRLNITDQEGNLIDFRGETITCRIHIKKDI